ncbi:hypothetical protein JX265_004202 [Neoarthrinium moseri]|uniref:P-loop containing nucleoside triphosphate hydrolase protein n=1 Tax=Neoarthrinium moseri TaxID=1658444 RepID=A0A9Q0AS74_9PEZI|nr:hypothetical protein JX265_004202 [Neoarthrinium moseri]
MPRKKVSALSEGLLLNGSLSSSIQTIFASTPGLKMLQKFFASWLRIDLSTLVLYITILGYFSDGFSELESIASRFYGLIVKFWTSSVSLAGDEPLNAHVLEWIQRKVIPQQKTRALAAGTALQKHYERDDTGMHDEEPIEYLPTFGTTWFFFEKTLFMVRLDPLSTTTRGATQANTYTAAPTGNEPLLIMCVGRSTEPIRRFLKCCNSFVSDRQAKNVSIYASKNGEIWDSLIYRPHRPLDTVHFEKGLKDEVVADITKYLKRETRDFYSARGIPYRRGYLFEGPPGTGKTSLAFAIAGHFNLPLWVLDLPTLANDASLEALFVKLSLKCVILIEDIDAVGLKRELSHVKQKDNEQKRKGKCTLAGLLNVLDGVTAQQGRIVLMTTNFIEHLDEALIRPGRVDKIFHLGKITQETARSMFICMYARERPEGTEVSAEIQKLASEFSNKIPERVFSPAQLQGYLLGYSTSPQLAVYEIQKWVENETAMAKAKKEKEKAAKAKSSDDEESKDDLEKRVRDLEATTEGSLGKLDGRVKELESMMEVVEDMSEATGEKENRVVTDTTQPGSADQGGISRKEEDHASLNGSEEASASSSGSSD